MPEKIEVGAVTIVLKYHSTECIRGWSWRVYGGPNDLYIEEQYGYGREDAVKAALKQILNLIDYRIQNYRERLRVLEKTAAACRLAQNSAS